MVNPKQTQISRHWVVEAISNPVVTNGTLVYNSQLLGEVEDAFVIAVQGVANGALQVVAQVAQTHDYPGGSLSATLGPNQVVLSVSQSFAGTLEAFSGTLEGVTINVLEHGA